MNYSVQLSKLARRKLDKLPETTGDLILDKIEQLKSDPRPPGCKKLTDTRPVSWRIRVGLYRVIYRIDDPQTLIRILDIDLRARVYKKKG